MWISWSPFYNYIVHCPKLYSGQCLFIKTNCVPDIAWCNAGTSRDTRAGCDWRGAGIHDLLDAQSISTCRTQPVVLLPSVRCISPTMEHWASVTYLIPLPAPFQTARNTSLSSDVVLGVDYCVRLCLAWWTYYSIETWRYQCYNLHLCIRARTHRSIAFVHTHLLPSEVMSWES